MSGRKDGGPAFPKPYSTGPNGMSLRDWFAGQALTSVTNNAYSREAASYAKHAYELADAMLAARNAAAGK